MKSGTFYGIGVGPGDPELMTVKGARVLSECVNVFVPKARIKSESIALDIAAEHLRKDAVVHEYVFPMVKDRAVLAEHWRKCAEEVAAVLARGEDACFLTLGDPLLYSTYIYLLNELKTVAPDAPVVTVPGVNAFSAAAALAGFPLGESKELITVVPASDDMAKIGRALDEGGTVVIMKVGARLGDIIALLDRKGFLDGSVFVARAGLEGQKVVADMRSLSDAPPETGYLSIILVHAGGKE